MFGAIVCEEASLEDSTIGIFHFNRRFATFPTLSTDSYGFQRCMLSRWNSVQSPGEDAAAAIELEASSEVCVFADVVAVASISQNGAIATIKPEILKDAICFLLARESEDFMAQPSMDFVDRYGAGRRVGWRRWVPAP